MKGGSDTFSAYRGTKGWTDPAGRLARESQVVDEHAQEMQ